MATVWLVRHAAAQAPAGRALGWTDAPLSPAGERRGRALAAELADRPLTRVLCSDLRRAARTAALVAAPHGLVPEPSSALREIDFGSWEGRALADLWVERPDEASAWEADLRRTPSGFGESYAQLERRVEAFWRGITPRHQVAVVAHRGPLAVLLRLLTAVTPEQAWQAPLEVGTATPVEVGGC